jgi:hypothetical protein
MKNERTTAALCNLRLFSLTKIDIGRQFFSQDHKGERLF